MTKPWLVIHADRANNPPSARKLYGLAPSPNKELKWQGLFSTRNGKRSQSPLFFRELGVGGWLMTIVR